MEGGVQDFMWSLILFTCRSAAVDSKWTYSSGRLYEDLNIRFQVRADALSIPMICCLEYYDSMPGISLIRTALLV